MQRIRLKSKEDRRLRRGHLWVFSNEIAESPESARAGDLVEVVSAGGSRIGTALYHPHSLIAARLLGEDVEALDHDFFTSRIGQAAALRERILPGEESFRLVHGESDFLPGLIVDRFGPCLVVQTLTAGMDRRLETIGDVLEELVRPDCIIERNDSELRRYEELEPRVSVLRGRRPESLIVCENSVRFQIDPMSGQKTGFFLDQKRNRRAVAALCRGQSVLDCFCNNGGFALNACAQGAARVMAVDVSAAALQQARINARLNEFDVEFVESDVFEFLKGLSSDDRYDVIILDPPGFARSRKHVPAAKRAYRRLNTLALDRVLEGGILATASCSFHLYEEVFAELVQDAALRAGRRLRLLQWRLQSPDHPILPAMPETRYLKLGIYQVL